MYNAPDDVRECLASVLAHLRPDVRVVLIDDASPDPRIRELFGQIEARAHPQVVLMRNEANLGFTGTANRGMQLSRADVILQNSDTIVTAGWLDAIMHCAATDARIGTITPFSNNAEILSFPNFCENNPWPPGADPAPIAAAIRAVAVPTYPDLPTGVGFCMYVRRALIDDVGIFDPVFGAGYGEENDLCRRAAAAGWRNVLADNAFVVHTGGRSFAGRKDELGPRNIEVLVARHPHYLDMVRAYIAADPLRPLRQAAQMRLAADATPGRGVLHVTHHHGGGTEAHVRGLIYGSRERWRHYLAIAVGDRWQVEEHRGDGTVVTFDFWRPPQESWRQFVRGVCATFGIGLVHLHHISASRAGIVEALADLPIPYGYTVHDLFVACPTITFHGPDGMYCGAQVDPAVCRRCLAAQETFAGVDIEAWRTQHHALLRGAAFRIAPSQWAADTLARYFPDCPATVIEHGSHAGFASPRPGARTVVLLPDDGVPTVAVMGAIGPDKGARRLERLVEIARKQGARVRFVLVGYLDFQHEPMQSPDARFTVHGHYDTSDLPELFAHYRVRLVLFPSAGPESFSYTLSEAWALGRPALVPPIGALPERVRAIGAGFVMTDAEWRDEASMLDRILRALADDDALRTAAQRARERAPDAQARMTEATLALYEAAADPAAHRSLAPLEPARLRYALSYVAWEPPPPTNPRRPAAPGLFARLARAAANRRHTTAGRFLFRIAPASVVSALRARLK
ncbi:MAG: glycosyltransferase [Burkholderiales bacterium]|nr:glycosyltransferase [Burkholderiales bacterium]